MTVFSATEIVFLDGPRVGSPASLEYFFVIKRPVSPVSKITMDVRSCSLKTRRCGATCVFKMCVADTGSLKCTLRPLVYSLGVLWEDGGVSRMR